jgi:hypothetical protein
VIPKEQNKTKREKMINKSKRNLEWAISFWIGVGLMSVINVWKINENQHALSYSWIMFGVSMVLIVTCAILIKIKK